jgi:hypothetical protein
MTAQPPPPTGAQRPRYEQPRVTAPTLIDFWRSDVRRAPGEKAPRWAGWSALVLGALAMLALFVGGASGNEVVVAASLALSWAGAFFALIALIADVGRWLGLIGLVFAVIGNIVLVEMIANSFT